MRADPLSGLLTPATVADVLTMDSISGRFLRLVTRDGILFGMNFSRAKLWQATVENGMNKRIGRCREWHVQENRGLSAAACERCCTSVWFGHF